MISRAALTLAFAICMVGPSTTHGQAPANTKAAPKVTGQWTGTWGPSLPKPPDPKAPALLMECTVVHKDGAWQATFEGECGRPYKYTIKMEGRPAGDVVLFKGSADLGERNGGVFDWLGRATEEQFVGYYSSAHYTGVFSLKRAKRDSLNS